MHIEDLGGWNSTITWVFKRTRRLRPYFWSVWYCVCTCVSSKFEFFFFLLKLNAVCTFWIVLMCWCQKWFLKNKKNHWHAFRHEKLFEKHQQPHCQTRSKSYVSVSWGGLALATFFFLLFSFSFSLSLSLCLKKGIGEEKKCDPLIILGYQIHSSFYFFIWFAS